MIFSSVAVKALSALNSKENTAVKLRRYLFIQEIV